MRAGKSLYLSPADALSSNENEYLRDRTNKGRGYTVSELDQLQVPKRSNIYICRIPDDCIDPKRYPLFIARDVLRELVQSLQSMGSLACK